MGRSQPANRAAEANGKSAYQQAMQVLQAAADLPDLVVFDLDYCLWPFWCEMYSVDDEPSLYPQSKAVLEALRDQNVPLALASRTPTPHVARSFLNKLGLPPFFVSIQLIPASSGFDQSSAQKDQAHFPKLLRDIGTPYKRMLFFDDEHKNVARVSKLGVTSILVSTSTGITVEVLQKGLQQFARQQ
ncbi:hypothetical protein WJX72_003782 [[Myrmecia] bisecta]|uniref:Magnesium-dependent phosphatase 1 n=1 Tax=[Myrmecia] bisecta TaxID=41462 RepID=A0AAW1Q2Y8_9CHLO